MPSPDAPLPAAPLNLGQRLTDSARRWPDAPAVIVQSHCRAVNHGTVSARYERFTFRQLDDDSTAVARGLVRWGVPPETRIALLVRPGFDFVSLVFGLLKAGLVQVLIDPGLGRRNMIRCLSEVAPQGFIAIPAAQAVRTVLRRRFAAARWNVTVGRRWFWGGMTLARLRQWGTAEQPLPATNAATPAAIIFTSGSTGPPKGVLYSHGNFDRQVEEIRDQYGIAPGTIDVSCFPLFALFNGLMGAATVLPQMDFSRPAQVDPRRIVAAIGDCAASQAFASPAVWKHVGQFCAARGQSLPTTLRRVLSAGAPVQEPVLAAMRACLPAHAEMHTPYGATEALPVATISASQVLTETAAATRAGRGVCVGGRFPGITWRVVRIVDRPLATLAEAEELPRGEIGELIVRGPVVTREYVLPPGATARGKISDSDHLWHRMGDAGYLDEHDRFWFCGRVSQRVQTAAGPLFTICCEAIFNQHPQVSRAALVGVGPAGNAVPVVWIERRRASSAAADLPWSQLQAELWKLAAEHPLTAAIRQVLEHPTTLPVDIRHNAKINREQLAAEAARLLNDL